MPSMKELFHSYVIFVGFVALTKLVVGPFVRNANVPLLKDVL